MAKKRRVFSPEFKAKIALAAVRGDRTTAQLAAQHKVHANQVSSWKSQLLQGVSSLFEDGRAAKAEAETNEVELYAQIGRLQMENAFLKKAAAQFE